MKTYGGVCIDLHFLDLGTSCRWVVSLTLPVALPSGKQPPGTQWIGGWVDPRTCPDNVEKSKFLTLPGLELRVLGRLEIASRYTDRAIPDPKKNIC
jgi:hypothetical protein